MKDKIVLIVGPTASGKTEISIKLAHKINAEIISADSMQIYKKMNIGTAKPNIEEMQGIKHYLIDEIEPEEEFSVALFKKQSEFYIANIIKNDKIPLIVGGTGLYVNSFVQTLDFTSAKPNEKIRIELENIAKEKGNEVLHNMLIDIDPLSADKIHPNNVKRIIRALEIYKTSGIAKSQWDERSMKNELKYEPILIGLNMDRKLLYNRINLRVDIMINNGLVDEVKRLLEEGYAETLVSMQGLGYKEIVKYLNGYYSLEEAIEIIKRDTRRFAKRQLTWFRRDNRINWFFTDEYENKDKILVDILKILEEKGINSI
ncbi:MAG: tRNA (adenosine(37)-N6)-dimethylallyltransferase MiaA [Eubacteriaceae bacterium]